MNIPEFVFPTNCGNSPKSLAIIDFYKLLFTSDIDEIRGFVSDNFVYKVHGLGVYEGDQGLLKLVQEIDRNKVQRLEIENVLSHGKYVAAHGRSVLRDGSELVFGEFFTFSSHGKNALIVRVDSYTVMTS